MIKTEKNKSVACGFKFATYFFIFSLLLSTVGIIGTVMASGQTVGAEETTPPAIAFIAPTPANGSTITVNYVTINVSVTDPSNVSTVLLNWNGVNETMNMTGLNTWSVDKTDLSNGEYTYKIYANDTWNNWGVSEVRTVNVMSAAAPTVSIDPASQDVSADDTFTVNVAVDPSGKGVSTGSITTSFNASVMQVNSAVAGDLLGTSPIVAPGYPKIDNTNGTVETDLSRFGATPVPTPKGTWAAITFTVNSGAPDGTYDITITSASLANETFVDIPGITITNGTVTVKTSLYPRWDINEDGKVDFKDLGILGAHYGETTATPYPRWDINEDGKVDFKDLGILGAHYGETYV